MQDEIKEVLNYYKKDTKEKWEWLKSIDFKYGDEKYIQRVKNHKLLLDYITNLQEKCVSLDKAYKNLQEEYEKTDYDRHKLFKQKEKLLEYIEMVRHFALVDKVNIMSMSTLENIIKGE